MNQTLLSFGILCMIVAGVISIIAHVSAQRQQQIQLPPFANQQQQPPQQGQQQQFPNQQQQQTNPGQQQYPPQLQQQFQRQQQQPVPLYNEPAVIACLNHQLVDSIVKAGTTGALMVHNSTNGKVTAGLNETFITNATATLDSCILPPTR